VRRSTRAMLFGAISILLWGLCYSEVTPAFFQFCLMFPAFGFTVAVLLQLVPDKLDKR